MNHKSPPLQESFRMSFTQTVLQHHRDCKVENTAAMPTLMALLMLLIIFYAWLNPLPNTSVVLSIEIKALRFSLWINACSCNASRWVRVV